MSDEFDRRDWAEDLNEGIRNRDTWFRGLKIILLLLLFLAIARFALIAIAIYQFGFCLVRNRPSEIVLPAGRWLSRYVEKIILFITWNSDHAPFPFTPFRDVMEQEPEYRDEEPAYQFEEEEFSEEEERSDPEPPALPPAEDEVADETGEEPEEEPEEPEDGEVGEDRSSPPPRPDA